MKLKDFIDDSFRKNPIRAMETCAKLIELEAIEQWMNVMWGIELEINVVTSEPKEGRFYGKGILDQI